MKLLHIVSTLAAAAVLAAAVPTVGAHHDLHLPDGLTARMIPANSYAYQVFTPDPDGVYRIKVTTYAKDAGVWAQSSVGATLRVFVWDVVAAEWVDVLSQPFTSSASAAVTVSFPASVIPDPAGFDMFVTFSSLGGDPVPTSHHGSAKNYAINRGLYDVADALDYHGVVYPMDP